MPCSNLIMKRTCIFIIYLPVHFRAIHSGYGIPWPVAKKDTIKIIDEDTVYTLLLAASQGDSTLVLDLLKAGISC